MRAQWGDCELLSVIYNSNTLVLVILESGVIDGRRSMMERRVPLLPSTVTK